MGRLPLQSLLYWCTPPEHMASKQVRVALWNLGSSTLGHWGWYLVEAWRGSWLQGLLRASSVDQLALQGVLVLCQSVLANLA